jgi:hypothetical protein
MSKTGPAAHPQRAAAIALWDSMDVKPSLPEFREQLAKQNITVSLNTIKQWRHKGHLGGELAERRGKKASTPKINRAIKNANAHVEKLLANGQPFDRERLQRMAGIAVEASAHLFVKVQHAIAEMPITKPSELVAVTTCGTMIADSVASVAKSLQLLELADREQDEGAKVITLADIKAAREAASAAAE